MPRCMRLRLTQPVTKSAASAAGPISSGGSVARGSGLRRPLRGGGDERLRRRLELRGGAADARGVVDVAPLVHLLVQQLRRVVEHLARRQQHGHLAVEPERAVVRLGVDAQLPESLRLLGGRSEKHLQPHEFDERVAVLRRELDRKLEELARDVEREALRVRVEEEPRALAPHLAALRHLLQRDEEHAELLVDARRVSSWMSTAHSRPVPRCLSNARSPRGARSAARARAPRPTPTRGRLSTPARSSAAPS